MNSAEARPVVLAALGIELGREPTLREVYAVQSVARHETGYGRGWKSPPHGPDAPASRNWGAIQAPSGTAPFIWLDTKDRPTEPAPPSTDPTRYFYALDYSPSHVRSDGGKGSWFWGPYRVYASDEDAAREVVRQLRKRGALEAAEREGTTDAVAAAMYGYFEGTSTNPSEAIDAYAAALDKSARAIGEQLGEEPALVRGAASPWPPRPDLPGDPSTPDSGAGWLALLAAFGGLVALGGVRIWRR